MAVEATVEPRAGLIPDGIAVVAVEKAKSEIQRRRRRAPVPVPVATGVMAGGKVTLAGLEPDTAYTLFPVVDEIQTVFVKAKKGKFKLTFEGQTTAGIKFNATAKEVEEALVALNNIAAGDIEVTGGPGSEAGGTYTIKFLKAWAALNVGALTADTTELEEAPKEVKVATTNDGAGAPPETAWSCGFRTPKE